jgi:hypothetical protein
MQDEMSDQALNCKYLIRVGVTESYKHNCLLQNGIEYGHKKFYHVRALLILMQQR